jgi:hypothetical protein
MRYADHDWNAPVDVFHGGADQRLAGFETEIGIFLRLHSGGDHHGSGAIAHHVVNLPAQGLLIDFEIGGKGRQRRYDQSRLSHGRAPRRRR